MRRYDDPVEVRRGWLEGPAHRGEGPEQFLWRGRLWKVCAVLAHWVETGPWWQAPGVRAVIGSDNPDSPDGPGTPGSPAADGVATAAPATDLLVERELWRVEAGRGTTAGTGPGGSGGSCGSGGPYQGVFDLSFDWTTGSWQLVGCVD